MALFTRKKIILAVAVLAVGLGVFIFKKPQAELVDVRIGNIEEAVYGLGKVKSNQVFEIKLGVISTLLKSFVREGDKVTAGQNLVHLDQSSIFRAPFAGTVTLLPYHESENIFPQTILLRLENLEKLYVEVALEQQGALRVKRGQTAKISLESLRGLLVQGSVESVFPRDDQFIVRVKSEGLNEQVLPGMTADVAILVGQKEKVLSVPVSSLSNGRVTILRREKPQKIAIKIGVVDRDWAEVIEGDVQAGDRVYVPRK